MGIVSTSFALPSRSPSTLSPINFRYHVSRCVHVSCSRPSGEGGRKLIAAGSLTAIMSKKMIFSIARRCLRADFSRQSGKFPDRAVIFTRQAIRPVPHNDTADSDKPVECAEMIRSIWTDSAFSHTKFNTSVVYRTRAYFVCSP